MDARSPSKVPAGSSVSDQDRLDSWKEIASYVKRQIRTVQRWEITEGLPIHRHQHSKHGSVYAYKSEIEVWWKARQGASKQRHPEPGQMPARSKALLKLLFPHSAIYALLVVALAFSVGKAKQMFLDRPAAASSRPVTLAVLPFQSISGSLADASTALDMTEEVITECKRSSAVHVVDQNLVMPFQNSVETPQQIAQLLHSDKVLSGTASRSGNGIHVAAQLIDSKSGHAIWSRRFEENSTDWLESEKDIASSIASDVENVVSGESHSLP